MILDHVSVSRLLMQAVHILRNNGIQKAGLYTSPQNLDSPLRWTISPLSE